MGGGGHSWGGALVGKEAILGGNSSCDSLALRLRLRDRSVLTAVAFGLDITRPVGPARSYSAHLAPPCRFDWGQLLARLGTLGNFKTYV